MKSNVSIIFLGLSALVLLGLSSCGDRGRTVIDQAYQLVETQPKQRITLSLSAYNALNRKCINELTVSDTFSREFRQTIVPAQYMFTVSFRY